MIVSAVSVLIVALWSMSLVAASLIPALNFAQFAKQEQGTDTSYVFLGGDDVAF